MAKEKPMKRTHYCGEIDDSFVGQYLVVYGWVNNKRELGGITFIDLRDREGILQIVINEGSFDKDLVRRIGKEYVLEVGGTVVKRTSPNPDLPSGQVELLAETVRILSESEVPPFEPDKRREVSEEIRFKHRYLDLRNPDLQKNFKIRSQANLKIRKYLDQHGFLDIETPMLSKATPEGARDYLVPSRIYKGKMFALPQSPQLFKQLFMVSGFERYYQIVKCFRDEDLRADRQPEFTQVDIEMSFADTTELFSIIEGMMAAIFTTTGKHLTGDFPVIPYERAMADYGSDKPDLRIPHTISDYSTDISILKSSLLNGIVEQKGVIKGLNLPDGAAFSRKKLDGINQYIQELGGKGAIWLKPGESGFTSSLKIESSDIEAFYKQQAIDPTRIVLLIGGEEKNALFLTGKLRDFLGQEYKDPSKLEFLWVNDFPLFFYNDEENRLDSNHHPFTAPKFEDMELLDNEPLKVKSIAYDLVLNGVEIGGGSRRINDINLQRKIFQLLQLSDREIEEKFGFFLNGLKYGTPPHLGIALGFDRTIMLLTGEQSIREVIAFPKTTSSLCLLTGSPSSVAKSQLDELGLKLKI